MGAALLAAGLLMASATASANGAGVTYRSASVTCRNATLYGNYSQSSGPEDKVGVVVRGEVVGYQYTNGSWAVVRTGGGDTVGFVLRGCITVPKAGTSRSYLWPAVGTCRDATLYANYNRKTHKPKDKTGVLRRGQHVGYQYVQDPRYPPGAWAVIRKATTGRTVYGYVLRSCLRVASWAPKATWNPPR